MARPTDWYDLSYDQQREWEANDRKHRAALEDAENEARQAKESAERTAQSSRERVQSLLNEQDEFAEEAGQLAQAVRDLRRQLALLHQFIREEGHEQAWTEWKRSQDAH